MIQPRTQTRRFWEKEFVLGEPDLEQLYSHFLDVQRPQPTPALVQVVMRSRVAADINDIKRRLSGRAIYQPKGDYAVGTELVFPNANFAFGTVVDVRDGFNPQEEAFKVIGVEINGKRREFASALTGMHEANVGDGGIDQFIALLDMDDVYERYSHLVEERLVEWLREHEDFLYLGSHWFVKSLLADINIGHLHLAEAVLDMFGGGPTPTADVLPHLELDKSIAREVQEFSLNYAMLNDGRFDEVAPKGRVAWFLRRLEPDAVQNPPERLLHEPRSYDEALLSPSLLQLDRELADEWSRYSVSYPPASLRYSIIYPHRLQGTLPLNAQLRAMLPLGRSPRQYFTARDMETGAEFPIWVVQQHRFISGFGDWFEENGVPVGGYITVQTSDDPAVLLVDCHRRRPQREDVRLASVNDDMQLKFELSRRRIGCNYDDLMFVGTDFTAGLDGLWSRLRKQGRSLTSVLALVLPELASLTPQGTVHAKTLYSATNMIFRVAPAPLFAELVRHPAFVAVGDQYWMFESSRWQRG